MVALNVEVGGLGRHAQRLQLVFQCQVRLLGIGVETLQLHHLAAHFVPHVGDAVGRVLHGEMPGLDGLVEVGDGEFGVVGRAVVPDAPHEEGEDGQRVLLHVFLEVEHLVVVERHHHTHVVKRGRVTLVVLDGIDVGVEDVGVAHDVLRCLCGPLHEEVVVGVHAGYHVLAHLVAHEVHEHLFLALGQTHLRGQHHLEVVLVVLKLAQHRAPEEHVVVTLHIGHDALARGLAVHAVDRAEVIGVEVVAQTFCHGRWGRAAILCR